MKDSIVKKIIRKINPFKGKWRILSLKADLERDNANFLSAALIYDCILDLENVTVSRLLQTGHMYKEARKFEKAENRYLRAYKLEPKNAEVCLQLGHFYKLIGKFSDANFYYRKSSILNHKNQKYLNEIDFLNEQDNILRRHKKYYLVEPSLFPKKDSELLIEHQPYFHLFNLGDGKKTKYGYGDVLSGVESIRGYIISDIPCISVKIFLNNLFICETSLKEFPIRNERYTEKIKKYVFNAWVDFSLDKYEKGRGILVIEVNNEKRNIRNGIYRIERSIIIEESAREAIFPDSYFFLPDKTSPKSLEDQINEAPTLIHRASTCSLPFEFKKIGILSPDQLGDLVASIPTILRIKELFPKVKIIAILSSRNIGLAKTLDFFDEIIEIDFPNHMKQGQRVMTEANQEELIEKLEGYDLDLAIDLPVCGDSFLLLPLSQARITAGYHKSSSKNIEYSVSCKEPGTGIEFLRYSARTRLVAEVLALLKDSGAKIIKRNDLSWDMITPYGLKKEEKYIVLHTGATLKFSQWPYYVQLAEKIIKELGLKVVFMSEKAEDKALFPSHLLKERKIIFLSGEFEFDLFDTFLSFASLFVGNDSGPKHLASLRGTTVISLHSPRTSWREWGQEQTGIILSRYVPCAECHIFFDVEECGKDFACMKYIKVEEVFEQVKLCLNNTKNSLKG